MTQAVDRLSHMRTHAVIRMQSPQLLPNLQEACQVGA